MVLSYDYEELLSLVKEEYGINSKVLSEFTGITEHIIDDIKLKSQGEYLGETRHLMNTLAFLSLKYDCGDEDELLRDYMNKCVELGLSLEAITKFTQLGPHILADFMEKKEIPLEEKYKLSVRFFFLFQLLVRNKDFQ